MNRSHPARPIRALPSALEDRDAIAGRIGERTPAVFLDYDGTLTPIVDDPTEASLPPETRAVLRRAAARMPVAVISGRDLAEVRKLVGLGDLWYAGSHGFEVAGPGGERSERATAHLPVLDAAESELRRALAEEGAPPEAWVERKRFAVAVHHRRTPRPRVDEVERRVREVAARHPELRTTGGKQVVEIRPDVGWDKGSTLLWLWDELGLDPSTRHPVYVGDDLTDEDAFRALAGDVDGTGVVVGDEDDRRETRANVRVEDPTRVRALLEFLVDVLRAREGPA